MLIQAEASGRVDDGQRWTNPGLFLIGGFRSRSFVGE